MINLIQAETADYFNDFKALRIKAHIGEPPPTFWYRNIDHRTWVAIFSYYDRMLFERQWLCGLVGDDETSDLLDAERERYELIKRYYYRFLKQEYLMDL